jgi:hypothetical protein
VTLRLARAFSAVRWSSPMARNDSSGGGAAAPMSPSLAVAISAGLRRSSDETGEVSERAWEA